MKSVKITKKVEIRGLDGSVRTIAKVVLNGFEDDFSGEVFVPAEELAKIDEIKADYAEIMLPEEIRALRKRYGKTQEDMCAILGLGNRTWTRWETGAVVPNASTCRTLFLLRDGKITLDDLCVQREKCMDWFGKPNARCCHCLGIASQFANMTYNRKLKEKGVGNAPSEVEVAA